MARRVSLSVSTRRELWIACTWASLANGLSICPSIARTNSRTFSTSSSGSPSRSSEFMPATISSSVSATTQSTPFSAKSAIDGGRPLPALDANFRMLLSVSSGFCSEPERMNSLPAIAESRMNHE